MNRRKPYVVTDIYDDLGRRVKPGGRLRVLGRFATEAEASRYIGTLPDAASGRYGLDGPEPKAKREPQVHRVFLSRHYIATVYFDVEASTPAEAVRKAKRAAYKVEPDPRAKATDNGWLPSDPADPTTVVPFPLSSAGRTRPGKTVQVLPGVHADPFDGERWGLKPS